MKENKPITWITFNNIFPIITSLVIMTLAFAKLQLDIALLNQKVDTVLVQQDKLIAKYADVEKRYGELALKVQTIETEHEINRSKQ